jgi:TolB-like protein/Tfp pilus assembly protein PilF
MVRFLTFVVEKTLAGEESQLKEYVLGTEVFDRPESFDPKADTIVRVEARRLRRKLKEYYDGEGAADTIRIDVPGPGYVPVISSTAAPLVATPPPATTPRKVVFAAAAAGFIVISLAAWWLTRTAGARSIDSIAVLPFSDMSSAKDQDYFCDGFTEELISTLAGTPGLRVVARTSVFAFKNKPADIREIGRVLNAAAIVEGSVRRDQGTLRITAQLIRTHDGYHIWSRSYDRKLEDVLTVQQELAEQIAGTLQKQLAKPSSPPSDSLEAHDLYLLGRYHWNRLEPDEIFKAIGYFEKAITLEPRSARNYSGLADSYSYLIDMDFAPTAEILPKARAAADRALALDPNSAEAHTARGLVAHELEWDQPRAQREFLRAIALKPNYAYGIHWYAHFLESQGRLEDALTQMNRALTIDPLSRMIVDDIAMIQWKLHRDGDALKSLERGRELDPDYVLYDLCRGLIYESQKDWPHALDALRLARQRMQDAPSALGILARDEALAGDTASARRDLALLKQAASKMYVPDYDLALVEYALGDIEQGRASLQKSIDAHCGLLLWLKTTPLFDQIAADPKGAELMRQIGM